MKNTKLTTYAAIACLGALLPAQAATTIIDGFSAHSGGALAANNIDGDWHGNGSAWSIGANTLTHDPSDPGFNNNVREGLIGQMITPTVGSSSILRLSFDYNVGASNRIYVHLRGFDVTGASPTWSINAFATNGNAWDSSANGTPYNLHDGLTLPTSGNANSGDAGEAVSFTGSGSAFLEINLKDYAVNDIADYEYLMLGFAANVGNVNNISTISNMTLAVPEPSSAALLGLGGLALMLRRKRN